MSEWPSTYTSISRRFESLCNAPGDEIFEACFRFMRLTYSVLTMEAEKATRIWHKDVIFTTDERTQIHEMRVIEEVNQSR